MKKFIDASSGEEEVWYKEALSQTLETIPSFLNKLCSDYSHDSVTFSHALVAGALGAIAAMNKTPEGDISADQKQRVLGLFTRKWAMIEGPFQITRWFGLLHSKSESQFRHIPKAVADQVSKKALEFLQAPDASSLSSEQTEHLKKIAEGQMPWGYVTSD